MLNISVHVTGKSILLSQLGKECGQCGTFKENLYIFSTMYKLRIDLLVFQEISKHRVKKKSIFDPVM